MRFEVPFWAGNVRSIDRLCILMGMESDVVWSVHDVMQDACRVCCWIFPTKKCRWRRSLVTWKSNSSWKRRNKHCKASNYALPSKSVSSFLINDGWSGCDACLTIRMNLEFCVSANANDERKSSSCSTATTCWHEWKLPPLLFSITNLRAVHEWATAINE